MTSNPLTSQELALGGTFGASALILPAIFHVIQLGSVFMPMYLPLVTLAFLVRPTVAAMTSVIAPMLSGLLTGMPPIYPPVAPVMSAELAAMALMLSFANGRFPRLPPLVLLAPVLVACRAIHALLMYGIATIMDLPAGFLAALSLIAGWPGIVLMLVVIPPIVHLVRRQTASSWTAN